MASRKMTFTLPVDLAQALTKRVPARLRSSYVSEAIHSKLSERENRLRLACEAANSDCNVVRTEQDWERLNDTEQIAEPWVDHGDTETR